MTLEELTKAGFTEDQAKKILEMHQKSIDGNYIPKATFEAERQKVKDANAIIAERDKQITELGSFKGTAEEGTAASRARARPGRRGAAGTPPHAFAYRR